MSEYTISQVYPTDKTVLAQIDTLLGQEGIRRDGNLDYICAMFDEEYNVIGTGSCFGNTLRCFAVSSAHQGEGLLNQIITHLIEVQCARGNMHLFLYTKVKSSKFFGDLGFYEIARVEDTLEDASLVPFAVRRKLVEAGVAHLPNVVLHDSGPYIISNATFPSYFLKDEAAVIDGHARLDLAVFTKIAAALNITARYVGEEPTSQVTGIPSRRCCPRPASTISAVRRQSRCWHASAMRAMSCITEKNFLSLCGHDNRNRTKYLL